MKEEFVKDFLDIYGINKDDGYINMDYEELVELIVNILDSYDRDTK